MKITSHIKGLDGLRAISLLLVLFAHWEPSARIAGMMEWGRGGLIMFFVISGFLITRLLIQDRLETPSGHFGHLLKRFYLRRAFRIFPLYYLVLAFVVGIDLTTAVTEDAAWHALFLNNLSAIFIRGSIGPYGPTFPWWSLAVEEQFYLLWAPVFLCAPRKWLLKIIVGAAVAAFTFRITGWAYGISLSKIFVFTLANFDALASGCLLAVAIYVVPADYKRRFDLFYKLSGYAAAIALGGLFILHSSLGQASYIPSIWNIVFSDVVWYLLAAATIYRFMISPEGLLATALSNRLLTFIGKRSYGIYILHQVVAHLMVLRIGPELESRLGFHFTFSGPVESLVFFIVTLGLACLSYTFFETPILRARERIPSVSNTR